MEWVGYILSGELLQRDSIWAFVSVNCHNGFEVKQPLRCDRNVQYRLSCVGLNGMHLPIMPAFTHFPPIWQGQESVDSWVRSSLMGRRCVFNEYSIPDDAEKCLKFMSICVTLDVKSVTKLGYKAVSDMSKWWVESSDRLLKEPRRWSTWMRTEFISYTSEDSEGGRNVDMKVNNGEKPSWM